MKQLRYYVLLIVCLVMTAAQAEAQDRSNNGVIGLRNPSVTRIGLPKTDLRVDKIFCGFYCCPSEECDLKGVNAFYMEKIKVHVTNYPCSDGKHINVESVLKVTYYDLLKHKEVEIIKTLPKMPNDGDEYWYLNVLIVDIPVLIKKSKGIRAEITPKNVNIIDGDSSNNVKIIKECDYDTIPVE